MVPWPRPQRVRGGKPILSRRRTSRISPTSSIRPGGTPIAGASRTAWASRTSTSSAAAVAKTPCAGSASGSTRPGSSPIATANPSDGAASGRGPRSPRLAASKLIRPVDEVPVWSIICVVVRSGHRRQGVTAHLLEGAVEYAASRGAPAIEAHPVDPDGRMDTTMAFVGTRAMFEQAGFRVIGTTDAVASRMTRLIMRRDL
nr:GNAT family N-acetyltransferase [Paeniglutamicibacter quisquiliarum]